MACTDAGLVRVCESSTVGPTALVVDDHAGFRAVARALLEAAELESRPRP
jgi:hypothetical protein